MAIKHFLVLIIATLLMVSCQAELSEPHTPTPTFPPPTAITEVPTLAPSPSHTPSTVNTPLPPPATAPIQTATAAPETTPAPQVTVPPEQPEGFIGPYRFPENTNPLTGEVVNPAALGQRPLAVKISNYPPLVRPQWGLNSADLVFEHYAEGGVTRFTAVFYSQQAEQVGSIRSGRLIDIEIAQMYDAAFAYSGSSGPVREMYRDSNFFERIISPDFGHGGFERIPDGEKAFEHTLFTNTYTLHYLLDQRQQDTPPNFATNMAFSPQPPANGTAVNQIEIRYRGTNAYWYYQSGTNHYLRWTDGEPHIDASTETQLNFRNIIVLGANHVDTEILEDFVGGGNYSIQIQLWGEGPVSIFRDGQRFEGQWRRSSPEHMLTFYDLEGHLLPLAPGNSFFQIVPLGFDGLNVS